ncbi:MAG: hypothetical protein AB7P08_04455 [Burkholderiales bacterium]
MRPFALLLLLPAFALADEAGMQRCRAIADATARLACYDALAATPAAPRASAPAAVPAQAAKPTPEQFGLEQRQVRELQSLDAIESTIPGRFDGWSPGASIRLANGQVWQVADGSSGAHWIENPKARVRRGLLGAFYLEIEGTNRSPRVQRVQ